MAHVSISSYDADSSGSSVEFITATPPDTGSEASTKRATLPAKQASVEDVSSDSENMINPKGNLPAAKAPIRPTNATQLKSVIDSGLQKLEDVFLDIQNPDIDLAGHRSAFQAMSSDLHCSSDQLPVSKPLASNEPSLAALLTRNNAANDLGQAMNTQQQSQTTSTNDNDGFGIPDTASCLRTALEDASVCSRSVIVRLQKSTKAAMDFNEQIDQMIHALDSTALKQQMKSDSEDVTNEAKSKKTGKDGHQWSGAWRKAKIILPWALVVVLCLVMYFMLMEASRVIFEQEKTIEMLSRTILYSGH